MCKHVTAKWDFEHKFFSHDSVLTKLQKAVVFYKNGRYSINLQCEENAWRRQLRATSPDKRNRKSKHAPWFGS